MQRSIESYADVRMMGTPCMQVAEELCGSNHAVATDPALQSQLQTSQPPGHETPYTTHSPVDNPDQSTLVESVETLQTNGQPRLPPEIRAPTDGGNAISISHHQTGDGVERDPTFRPITWHIKLMFGSDSSDHGELSIPHLRSSRASYERIFEDFNAVLDLPRATTYEDQFAPQG
ncbi:hypothetical protein BDD12DRAFT_324730 [Trichophaea hybrida]|nr:hypothetical protein BDD12DRAFT_324730 [Trichophaea hybrida]